MKKIFLNTKILMIGLLMLGINQSCTNLETELFDSIGQENFFQTQEELEAGFAEAYARLSGLYGHNGYFSAQLVSSDEAMIPQRGGDWFDGGIWLRTHRHEFVATEDVVRNTWGTLYSSINLDNLLIETFETQAADPALISELKVLRAFQYLLLMDIFGNVPIVAETGLQLPSNNTSAEVYAFIESEVTEALPNLNKDVSSMYGRFHYYAAQALLAKLYINAEVYSGNPQWGKAVTACNEVLDGPFTLESDYFANFNANNDASNELGFRVPYDAINLKGFNLPQMTLHYGSQATFDLQEQPWNGYCSLADFYNSYDDADNRKGTYGNQQIRGNFLAGPQFASDGVTAISIYS